MLINRSSIDLSLPTNGSIDRLDPAWTTNLLDLYLDTINVFSKYDNVLGYNIGNEIVVQANGTAAAAFIKAAARDVKAYLYVPHGTRFQMYALTMLCQDFQGYERSRRLRCY